MSATLSLRRSDLRRGIRQVAVGLNPRRRAEVRIEYTGGKVCLYGPGAVVELDGEGRWPGSAFVDAGALKRLAPRLPRETVLHVEFRDNRLFIEDFSLPARWQDIAPAPTTVPIGASLGEILRIAQTMPEAVIVSSGLSDAVAAAREEAEHRRARAAEALAPLGIAIDDLRGVLRQKLSLPSAAAAEKPSEV